MQLCAFSLILVVFGGFWCFLVVFDGFLLVFGVFWLFLVVFDWVLLVCGGFWWFWWFLMVFGSFLVKKKSKTLSSP